MTETASKVLAALQARFPGVVRETHAHVGDETALIHKKALRDVAKFLKQDAAMDFNFLMDVTAVDYPQDVERFEVVYHFYSLAYNHRLRLKVRVAEEDAVLDTLTGLWASADWFEREVWDMFGIRFSGHPNLKRILMYDEFVGHPLRKDYPINKRQPRVPQRPVNVPSPQNRPDNLSY